MPSIVEQLNNINATLSQIQMALANPPFWQSNIFAAIIGFSGGILVFILDLLVRAFDTRKVHLRKIYDWFLTQFVFFSPQSLVDLARMHIYASTLTRNGVTTQIPEKPLAEKMVIEFKKRIKYQTFPKFSQIKNLLGQYEKELSKFPEYGDAQMEAHLKSADAIYDQIKTLIYKETGENEFTVR
jgi:hypothetical protein